MKHPIHPSRLPIDATPGVRLACRGREEETCDRGEDEETYENEYEYEHEYEEYKAHDHCPGMEFGCTVHRSRARRAQGHQLHPGGG